MTEIIIVKDLEHEYRLRYEPVNKFWISNQHDEEIKLDSQAFEKEEKK